ncbi:DNA methylase [Ornithobacterium rhinotracheale]|uniref:DNA methylase n=1 Tax=Ornithobacterium rhinotracheale TaxID=28251 RepID=UPI004039A9D5
MQNKIKQSETRVIKRSEITPAPYNPRTITDEARKALKKNIKKNGIIGGMVWNEETTNLVSGHQKLSIADEVNKYNPNTKENDYDIKVEVISVDLKTEKELNIFFNSKSVQGEMDSAKLAEMLPDIDADLAGLDEVDLSLIDIEVPEDLNIEIPTFEPQAEKKEEAQQQEEEEPEDQSQPSYEERKAKIKEIKSKVNDGAVYEGEPYLTLSFDSYENKMFFLERFGLDDTKFIKGEEFAEMLDQ